MKSISHLFLLIIIFSACSSESSQNIETKLFDRSEFNLISETIRADEFIKVVGSESFGYIVTASSLDSIVYYKYSCCAKDTTDMINAGNTALNNFLYSLLE